MNSYDFFIHEFIFFMNSYMNLGVPRFQMVYCNYTSIIMEKDGHLQHSEIGSAHLGAQCACATATVSCND